MAGTTGRSSPTWSHKKDEPVTARNVGGIRKGCPYISCDHMKLDELLLRLTGGLLGNCCRSGHAAPSSSFQRNCRQHIAIVLYLAVLLPVIKIHLPQIAVPTTPSEYNGITCRGDAPAGCKARAEGIHRFNTIVRYVRAVCATGWGRGGCEDAMRQIIRTIRRGDIVSHHATLAWRRCPASGHPTHEGLWHTPGTPCVCRGNEANTQLCGARWVEVIRQTQLGTTP